MDLSAGAVSLNGGADPAPGLVVAERYRLDRPIGRGGMGSVWAANHLVTRRPVALKFLRRSEESEESRLRFVREARAACAVLHPNVVEVLDFVELDDRAPVMVLELLDGESLASLLAREGRLSVARTAEIIAPVASAVGTAHAEGIVHRDLKPDNIFLHRERDGTIVVKVLDFGIAKVSVVDADTSRDAGLTHTGAVLGTPMYMSPEQVFAETDLDHRADIWALGIILYRCLSGVLPTEAPNVGQVYKIILAGKIKPLREVAADLPEELARLVDQMLSREREARPSDLSAVLSTLQRYTERPVPTFGPPRTLVRSEHGEARDESVDSPPTLVLPASPAARAPELAPTPAGRRWLPVGAAVLVVAVSASGLVLSMGRATEPRPEPTTSVGVVSGAPSAAPAPAGSAVEPAPVSVSGTSTTTAVDPRRKRDDAATALPKPSAASRRVPRPAGSISPEDPYGF